MFRKLRYKLDSKKIIVPYYTLTHLPNCPSITIPNHLPAHGDIFTIQNPVPKHHDFLQKLALSIWYEYLPLWWWTPCKYRLRHFSL